MSMRRGTSFAEAHPELLWMWSSANTKGPEAVTYKSSERAWWKCRSGHEFETQVGSIAGGHGCPYCAGKRPVVGVNDLATLHPAIATQWDYASNGELRPEGVTAGSGRKVGWVCDLGHQWRATVVGRTSRGSGCPYCVGRLVLAGFNDLETTAPDALEYWDYQRNTKLPTEVQSGSHEKVYWKGRCGHSWSAPVRHVAQKGFGCAVCAGKHGGFDGNTLASAEPEIAAEWHPDNDRPPSEVTRVSAYRARWLCRAGHEFTVRVCDRVNYQTGCPKCSGASISKQEKALAAFIRSLGVDVQTNTRDLVEHYEADIYIPSSNVAIEYNGLYWHSEGRKGASYHLDKFDAFEKAGVRLIYVWEDDWTHRRAAVERSVARKLGKSTEARFNARELMHSVASVVQAREFLDENHIQGYVPASVRLSLVEADGTLRALMAFRVRPGGTWELSRYATNGIVRGGFSKLLHRFIAEYAPEKIVTFADRGISDGGLYADAGFVADQVLPPDYKYRVRNRREHKFNYRIARFRKDPNLKFEDGLTERELAKLNGLDRVYDAGKVRWVLTP